MTGLLILHFLIASVHIFVKNSDHDEIKNWTSCYIDPFFIQEWEMFAPPPQSNTKLFYRFLIRRQDGVSDTTDFQEILEPLYKKQKNEIYSLARLSYYLFNCSQNLLSQCHDFVVNLPTNLDPCDSVQIQTTFHNKIQKSYSYQSIARHAKIIFQQHYGINPGEEIYFSFHLLEETIPDYTRKDELQPSDLSQLTAYNSTFYQLNFK